MFLLRMKPFCLVMSFVSVNARNKIVENNYLITSIFKQCRQIEIKYKSAILFN